MVNISTFNRPKGRADNLSVVLGDVQILVSAFSASFAFDAFSHAFSFETPVKIPAFVKDEVNVYIGKTLIFTGVVFSVETDGVLFKVSGKSLTAILERSSAVPTTTRLSLSNIPILALAQLYGRPLGINFSSNHPSALRIGRQYEINDSDTVAEIITRICKENSLYVFANAENNTAELRDTKSFGKYLFELDSENPNIPFDNLKVVYNSASLYSNYIAISEPSERNLFNASQRSLPQAPFRSFKVIIPAQNQNVETALDSEQIKSLVSATKISLSVPFVVFADKIIKAGDTFFMNAKRYGIENREFFITKLNYIISSGEIRADISACLVSALRGVWE